MIIRLFKGVGHFLMARLPLQNSRQVKLEGMAEFFHDFIHKAVVLLLIPRPLNRGAGLGLDEKQLVLLRPVDELNRPDPLAAVEQFGFFDAEAARVFKGTEGHPRFYKSLHHSIAFLISSW